MKNVTISIFSVLFFFFSQISIAKDNYIQYTERDLVIASLYMYKSKLPLQVSKGFMLVDADISNDEVIFTHIVTDNDYAIEMETVSKRKMKEMLIPYACKGDSKLFFNNGFLTTFSYYNKDGFHLIDITYNKSDCVAY